MAFVKENYSNIETCCAEKHKQLQTLVEQESQAIADDNYDLAEELATTIDQLKQDIEKSKYRVPVGDVKVNYLICNFCIFV